jgi:hypothetical protein
MAKHHKQQNVGRLQHFRRNYGRTPQTAKLWQNTTNSKPMAKHPQTAKLWRLQHFRRNYGETSQTAKLWRLQHFRRNYGKTPQTAKLWQNTHKQQNYGKTPTNSKAMAKHHKQQTYGKTPTNSKPMAKHPQTAKLWQNTHKQQNYGKTPPATKHRQTSTHGENTARAAAKRANSSNRAPAESVICPSRAPYNYCIAKLSLCAKHKFHNFEPPPPMAPAPPCVWRCRLGWPRRHS